MELRQEARLAVFSSTLKQSKSLFVPRMAGESNEIIGAGVFAVYMMGDCDIFFWVENLHPWVFFWVKGSLTYFFRS